MFHSGCFPLSCGDVYRIITNIGQFFHGCNGGNQLFFLIFFLLGGQYPVAPPPLGGAPGFSQGPPTKTEVNFYVFIYYL